MRWAFLWSEDGGNQQGAAGIRVATGHAQGKDESGKQRVIGG